MFFYTNDFFNLFFSKNLREDLFERKKFSMEREISVFARFLLSRFKESRWFFNQFWFKSSSGNLFNATEFSCKSFLV